MLRLVGQGESNPHSFEEVTRSTMGLPRSFSTCQKPQTLARHQYTIVVYRTVVQLANRRTFILVTDIAIRYGHFCRNLHFRSICADRTISSLTSQRVVSTGSRRLPSVLPACS